jgi:[acyl-carrier-protein] S-malonyltransferase
VGGEPLQDLEGGDVEHRRAIVFPGQGTAGGEVSGEVAKAVKNEIGETELPYQLSVFANAVHLFHKLRDAGISPDVVAGHSLGEYAAAYAAGSLSLEDGVRLVAERDRLMNEASASNPGGMVAIVGGDPNVVNEVVANADGVVVAANFNTPRQTVISGEKEALETASEKIKGRKVPLEVAGAFHSPLMEEAAKEMESLLSEVEFCEPEVPLVSATDGSVLSSAGELREAFQKQMLSPVRWVAVVERFSELGVEEVLECGEGGTLVRMLRDFKDKKFDAKVAGEVVS